MFSKIKLQRRRGLQSIFGWKAAPVLEFGLHLDTLAGKAPAIN